MEIAFDPDKDAANVLKHGVSLAFGANVWLDPNWISIPSHRLIDGEERYKAVGLVADRLWTSVFVVRGHTTRLISVRRSNDGERRLYDRA